MINIEKRVSEYLNQKTWEVRENSNIPYSWAGLMLNVSGGVIAEYALDHIYPKRISNAHRSGDMHIHNLYMGIIGYCAGWDLEKLLLEGFNGVPGKIASKPAKHFDTALMQMVNFLGTIQNEWAGAQAFNAIDTYLAPFVYYDKLTYKQVKQDIQKFIFNLNISSRWGSQSPFTNITLDWTISKDLAKKNVIIGGELKNRTYSEFQKQADIINKAIIEVFLEGDMNHRPFTFPIPSYNITKDFDWDSKNAELLFEMTAKYGLPYFSNFVNTDLKPSDIRSMCCHLRLDMRQLYRNVTSGLFGSGDTTGSVGVVSINMPRIGYLSKNEKQFFERLEKIMNLAKESLEIKRRIVEKNISGGLLPYSKRYLGTLENHFSTIGLVGMNEALLNLFGFGIATKEGKKFTIKTLKFMKKKLVEFQKETGHMFNLEATPAESVAYRFALKDKKRYHEIITSGKKEPYYTNSTWLPVYKTKDLAFALEHQSDIQKHYTGGTVFHAFLGEKLPNAEACKNLVKKIAYNTEIPYFTITPTYSICHEHGYFSGEHNKCPICKKPCEVYSRIVGYFRPTSNWNAGKQEEYRQRKTYERSA